MLEDNLLPEVSDLYGAAMDPHAARIRELIARLARPDDPSMVPTTPQLSTGGTIARTGLAGLGDLLTAIGFSKGGRIPPSNFLSQVANENNQRREAVAENARRVRQAAIEADKTGAGLELRDVQTRRAQDIQQHAQDLVQRAQDLKDKHDREVLEQKTRHQAEMQDFREKVQRERLASIDKQIASREKIARARGAHAGAGLSPGAKRIGQLIQTERTFLADLLKQRDKVKIMGEAVDPNALADINAQIDASTAKLYDLAQQQEDAAATAPAAPAPGAPAPKAGDGWGTVVKH